MGSKNGGSAMCCGHGLVLESKLHEKSGPAQSCGPDLAIQRMHVSASRHFNRMPSHLLILMVEREMNEVQKVRVASESDWFSASFVVRHPNIFR